VALHSPDAECLQFEVKGGSIQSLADPGYEKLYMKNDRAETEDMQAWLDLFRNKFDVFFSAPLDLDLSMLENFNFAYTSQAPQGGGPRLPNEEPQRGDAVRARMRQVLAADPSTAPADLGSTYTNDQLELFPWYKYLFIDGSKPVTHMRAMVALDEFLLTEMAPESLKSLINRARQIVAPQEGPA
jgi:putative ATP-dependent endonuclease of the OLD family